MHVINPSQGPWHAHLLSIGSNHLIFGGRVMSFSEAGGVIVSILYFI